MYVVVGCFDVYFEFGLKFWDIVVGELIVKEVGGIVVDVCGGSEFMENG